MADEHTHCSGCGRKVRRSLGYDRRWVNHAGQCVRYGEAPDAPGPLPHVMGRDLRRGDEDG